MVERSDLVLRPRTDVTMWHVCLVVDATKAPVAVSVTTNPLEHGAYAQVVMHKTRSHGCAVQVARYVRRTFGITVPVTEHRAARPVEAMIGYACTRTAQHAPNDRTPGWGVFQHIAATPIADLLREVAGGHSTASTRYVVYEVRCPGHGPIRGITNKFNALERRYREAPPDQYPGAEIFLVGRFPTQDEARRALGGLGDAAGDWMWTRKPSAEYVRSRLKIDESGEIVWRHDGSAATRAYDFTAVVIGPHVYTERQVRGVLEHGRWDDARRTT